MWNSCKARHLGAHGARAQYATVARRYTVYWSEAYLKFLTLSNNICSPNKKLLEINSDLWARRPFSFYVMILTVWERERGKGGGIHFRRSILIVLVFCVTSCSVKHFSQWNRIEMVEVIWAYIRSVWKEMQKKRGLKGSRNK